MSAWQSFLQEQAATNKSPITGSRAQPCKLPHTRKTRCSPVPSPGVPRNAGAITQLPPKPFYATAGLVYCIALPALPQARACRTAPHRTPHHTTPHRTAPHHNQHIGAPPACLSVGRPPGCRPRPLAQRRGASYRRGACAAAGQRQARRAAAAAAAAPAHHASAADLRNTDTDADTDTQTQTQTQTPHRHTHSCTVQQEAEDQGLASSRQYPDDGQRLTQHTVHLANLIICDPEKTSAHTPHGLTPRPASLPFPLPATAHLRRVTHAWPHAAGARPARPGAGGDAHSLQSERGRACKHHRVGLDGGNRVGASSARAARTFRR